MVRFASSASSLYCARRRVRTRGVSRRRSIKRARVHHLPVDEPFTRASHLEIFKSSQLSLFKSPAHRRRRRRRTLFLDSDSASYFARSGLLLLVISFVFGASFSDARTFASLAIAVVDECRR